VRAPADGYTLLLATSPNATNATLYPNLNFNFIRDIAPVASIGRVASVMEVHPSFPAKTVPEFIAHARANPGKISFGSTGNGTTGHTSGELFKMMTGVNMVHVPYRGGPAALPRTAAGGHLRTLAPQQEDHALAGARSRLAALHQAASGGQVRGYARDKNWSVMLSASFEVTS
jgi:tripartite-type tricarboxylate transporter receptor subunit TctC